MIMNFEANFSYTPEKITEIMRAVRDYRCMKHPFNKKVVVAKMQDEFEGSLSIVRLNLIFMRPDNEKIEEAEDEVVYYDGEVMTEDEFRKKLETKDEDVSKTYYELDKKLWNRYYPGSDEADFDYYANENRWKSIFEADVESILSNSLFDLEAAVKDITAECKAKMIEFDYGKIKKVVELRRGLAKALDSYKNVSDLAHDLGYALSPRDLENLAAIHSKGKKRKKIEALLEAANFHTACGYFTNKKYDIYLPTTFEEKISVLVYADSTDLFTQEEIEEDNLADLDFPKAIVNAYFLVTKPFSTETFEEWLENYTADETEGLYDFAIERGFKAERENTPYDNKNKEE